MSKWTENARQIWKALDNLNYFCKMNGLDTAAMQRVCSGKQKSHIPKRKDRVPNVVGWTVRILEHIT